ncbi:hypothetical protein MOBT1_001082 [Malassezia obtusa]|uniref:chitin deacetylase n=1 Tax=Malassezia obtusa TaxID=76774 RepID=A0AAF0DZG6_9BASI|nr:hypothetical protein MOBT1_001082 [Malassezia obtusa]
MQKAYPEANKPASIVQGDNDANSIWSDIKKSGIIPSDVKVKPQKQGNDHMSVSPEGYDTQSDPDCWWTAKQCVQPKHKGLPMDLASCPEPDTWGLTFDDGPNCTHNEFYDFLSQNKLKATLFYIGSYVLLHPYQGQRGIVDGHDICVHTWSHHYTTTLEDEQVFAELYYTAKIIKQVLGVTPTCWRPPYGDTDDRVRAIAYGLGLRTILWEEDTHDWEIAPAGKASPQQIDQNYQKIIDKSKSESPIVLTHEINSQTMKEFQKMYPKIKDAYKNVVPLTACQNVTKPYADSDIEYPAFSDFANGKIQPSNLPKGDSIKIDPQAKYQPKKLNDTSNGYAHPQSGKGGGKSGGSKDSAAAALSISYASMVAIIGGAVISALALL